MTNNTPLNADDELHRKQQELYFNVDGVLTTLVLRTKRENMSVSDVKRRDEATERILAIIESDRKKHELQARIDSLLTAKRLINETDLFELGLAMGIIDSELKKLGWTPGELKQELEKL